MRINHNIASLNTYRQLTGNQAATNKNIEKLSSGLRINRAGDDAAGLAISEKMRGQIRGLDMASKNSQDGISLIQTAEGALNETHSILQRMRELAVQSGNDTNTAQDRSNLQDEMNQLTSEIDRIRNTTQFNTKNLLDGSMGAAVNTAVANVQTSAVIKAGGAAATATSLVTALQDANGNSLGISVGDTITVSWVTNGTTKTGSLTVAAGTDIAAIGALATDGGLTVNASGQMVETATTAGFAGAVNGLTITVKDSSGNIRTAATNALSSFQETTAAANVQTDGRATFQIGANSNQTIQLDVKDMGASALGVNGLQISTQSQATVALKVIDTAIQKVSAQRSSLGAIQNRLEHTINNLNTSSENLTAAESRIRDTDMAKEMMEQTKNNILAQAAQAMLAQSNSQPQGVLQLLR
ncbi:flagellin N-terminal helical domain-containing protein [Brevibacillus agri]|uniref:flagellin N-terminal helical domain-containing protein n=1 Tax=Brevibacillus agri TaxID=51101 RepID=UPI001EE5951C|nr:flagellin [Brevibacillus agri]MCG5250136.1 flagellin [Brevibacillus agri]MDT7985587.1 flagellin [Clostridium perfringens]